MPATIGTRATNADILSSLHRVEESLANLSSAYDALKQSSIERQNLTDAFFETKVIDVLVQSILPIVDFAEQAGAKEDATAEQTKALRGVGKTLLEFLRRYGVEQIPLPSNGLFDESIMTASKEVPNSDPQENNRVTVIQTGYRRDKRTLRELLVSVQRNVNHKNTATEVA